ncbi:carbohydrate ABC transporter permease [Ruminococcaceae bacterium OttesenSCG-928-A16]|nr:carbohydrate ABC transporter permease [Ruminococcaceae bacterium OttesenSCG-928-A16]
MPNKTAAVQLKRRRISPSKIITYIILSLWAVTTIFPFIWVIINSFKERKYILTQSFALPIGELFTLNNFTETFEKFAVGPAYRNSLIISGTVTIAVIIISGLCAYGMARYNFRGRKILQTLLIASMMFPVFSTIIPVFSMQTKWGIVNNTVPLSWVSVILPQIAGNIAFGTVVLMGYIRSLPIDLEEAAYLEGYGVFRIFFRIIMPLAKPSFATIAIFSFLWSYNDLFTQMFYLRSADYFTITRLLNEISSQSGGTNHGWMAAAVVIVVIPVLVVYVFLQKNIVKGLTAGAIKG